MLCQVYGKQPIYPGIGVAKGKVVMNNESIHPLASCTRYKIGFFGLLVVIVVLFSLYVSSTVMNMTYKNRASDTNLTPAGQGSGVSSPEMIMTPVHIIAMHPNQPDSTPPTYIVTIEEAPVSPLAVPSHAHDITMLGASGATNTPIPSPRPTSPPNRLTCTLTPRTLITENIHPSTAPTPIETAHDMITPITTSAPSTESTIPHSASDLMQIVADDHIMTRTYTVGYQIDATNVCTITSVILQSAPTL
jgi:hypothetical protein